MGVPPRAGVMPCSDSSCRLTRTLRAVVGIGAVSDALLILRDVRVVKENIEELRAAPPL